MNLTDNLKKAINSAQKAQRNYDLSKSIPKEDLETLIYAAVNSPSKQNETHYALYVFTDQETIKQIYNYTKKFALGIQEALEPDKGEQWLYENRSVKNSQILANALFVYVDDNGEARGATHLKGKHGDSFGQQILNEQKNFSIGISVGELILTANLIGYKTGICSAMEEEPIKKILNTTKQPKLLVGVGYNNSDVDRRYHAETLNKDVPVSKRTGELDERWKFPSFTKYTNLYVNHIKQF